LKTMEMVGKVDVAGPDGLAWAGAGVASFWSGI
jgi:hypothetical protein